MILVYKYFSNLKKAIGVSLNPIPDDWYSIRKCDDSMIMYFVKDGEVHGGSGSERVIKEVVEDCDGFYPGGTFTFELDRSKRSLVMETEGEIFIIDQDVGDFEYVPVILSTDPQIKITIL